MLLVRFVFLVSLVMFMRFLVFCMGFVVLMPLVMLVRVGSVVLLIMLMSFVMTVLFVLFVLFGVRPNTFACRRVVVALSRSFSAFLAGKTAMFAACERIPWQIGSSEMIQIRPLRFLLDRPAIAIP